MEEIQYRFYLYNKDKTHEDFLGSKYHQMTDDCLRICVDFKRNELAKKEKDCLKNCMSKYLGSILLMNKALLR